MKTRFITTLMCSALVSIMAATGLANADPIGRYECNIVGIGNPEPLGDRAGHGLVSYQFSCYGVEGILKGAVYSAVHVSEWEGQQGNFLLAGGVHRIAGGFAVTQMTEGAATVIMKDGKPAGVTGSGKAVFELGSGSLAALSGKAVKFTSKSTGVNRFELDFAD
jgi:hypothetical protein